MVAVAKSWPVVRASFMGHSVPREGRCTFMYADQKNLVTTAVGNMIDSSPLQYPWSPALFLPWRRNGGPLATRAEVIAAWRRVKEWPNPGATGPNAIAARLAHAKQGGKAGYESVTNLRISDIDVDRLVYAKFDANDAHLCRRFPGHLGVLDSFAEWPAPAQLATHSMAWAMGAGFHFPKWEAFARKLDFIGCAKECHMDERGANVELKTRNRKNEELFLQAARVMAAQGPRDVL